MTVAGTTTAPVVNTTVHSRNKNISLALTLGGRTGNVLFEMASGIAIAAHYNLDLCVDPSLRSAPGAYGTVMEIAPLLNNVPKKCPGNIQKSLESGKKINLFNRCCVFEDFYSTHGAFLWSQIVRTHSLSKTTKMGLEDLFGQPREKLGDLYHLHGFRQSWKYLEMGPKETELRLKKEVILEARKKLESLAPFRKRVAIHLRVTDASKAGSIFHFPGPEYFHEAMQHFREKWGNITFFVFSDAWCRRASTYDVDKLLILFDPFSVTKIYSLAAYLLHFFTPLPLRGRHTWKSPQAAVPLCWSGRARCGEGLRECGGGEEQ